MFFRWMTKIVLPLKEDMRLQTLTLAARFHDIHPSLLLFLHRLRKITIENKVEYRKVRFALCEIMGENVASPCMKESLIYGNCKDSCQSAQKRGYIYVLKFVHQFFSVQFSALFF